LALLALSIQFAVSFGHIHADELRGSAMQAAAATAAPSSDDADHHDHDGVCAICVAILLLANAPLAAPPVVGFAPLPAGDVIDPQPRTAVAAAARVAFRSRAPPRA
jgi:hypothetical protein